MTYMAPWVALSLCVAHCLCFVQINCERHWKCTKIRPWYLNAYWLQYITVGYLSMSEIMNVVTNTMWPSQWMNPDVTRTHVQCQMINEHECFVDDALANQTCNSTCFNEGLCPDAMGCDSNSFKTWESETDLSGNAFYPFIRMFSLTTPFWLLGTFGVCAYHTYKHSKKMQEGGLWANPTRRMIIAVILLPLVWALMSFCSVVRSLQIAVDHVVVNSTCGGAHGNMFHNYHERKLFLLEMYESNFNVAGIYQAISMFIFAEIITSLVMVKAKKLKSRQTMSSLGTVAQTKMYSVIQRAMSHHHEHDLDSVEAYHTITKMTMEGVLLFSVQSVAKGLLSLFITTMAFDFCGVNDRLFSFQSASPGLFQRRQIKDEIHFLFTGISLVASYNAMRHIGCVQNGVLHGEKFDPHTKCNTIKVLTSLQSVQPFVFRFVSQTLHILLGYNDLGSLRANLFLASLMCMESFFIALVNLKAWHQDETWIDEFPSDTRDAIVAKMNDPFHEFNSQIKDFWYSRCGKDPRKNSDLADSGEPLLG